MLACAFRVLPDVEGLLSALSNDIRSRTQSLQQAAVVSGSDSDWPDSDYYADENAMIDEAVGLGFVVCQSFVTAMISSCQGLHRFYATHVKHAGKALDKDYLALVRDLFRKFYWNRANRSREEIKLQRIGNLSGNASELLQNYCAMVGQTGVSRVSAINALANYFKHRDEWPSDWRKLNTQQRRTAKILKKLGFLSCQCKRIVRSGDFGSGFNAIVEHRNYDALIDLKKILDNWRGEIEKRYQEEFKARRLT